MLLSLWPAFMPILKTIEPRRVEFTFLPKQPAQIHRPTRIVFPDNSKRQREDDSLLLLLT